MLKRIGVHLMLCLAWTLFAVLAVPISWVMMDEVFWSLGIGTVLTERPVAAAHHRVMGTLREFDSQGGQISNLQGPIRAYPDSPHQSAWQAELAQAQSDRNRLLAKALAVLALLYVPLGVFLELWRRYGPEYDLQEAPFEPY